MDSDDLVYFENCVLVSKALERSKKIPKGVSSLSIYCVVPSINSIAGNSVQWFFLKLY